MADQKLTWETNRSHAGRRRAELLRWRSAHGRRSMASRRLGRAAPEAKEGAGTTKKSFGYGLLCENLEGS